jgi:hypothetical protein
MKNKSLLALTAISLLFVNSATAQNGEIALQCTDQELNLGESTDCYVTEFPQDVQPSTSEYDYSWTVEPGEVESQTVESVKASLPEITSSGEAKIEYVISGEETKYSQTVSIEIASSNDGEETESGSNSSERERYGTPVEQELGEENESSRGEKAFETPVEEPTKNPVENPGNSEKVKELRTKIEAQRETIEKLRNRIEELKSEESKSNESSLAPPTPPTSSEREEEEENQEVSDQPPTPTETENEETENKQEKPNEELSKESESTEDQPNGGSFVESLRNILS